MPSSDSDAGLPAQRSALPRSIHVSAFDRTDSASLDLDRWTEVATRTLTGESVSVGQLDLIFVNVDEMADLNQIHMGHEGPTDVLSFPLDTEDDDFPAIPEGQIDSFAGELGARGESGNRGESGDSGESGDGGPMPVHLGDIVVCPEVAERQAPDHCGTLDAELSLLIVHGVLHILGHDHVEPEETRLMQERERVHLAALGLTHPVPA